MAGPQVAGGAPPGPGTRRPGRRARRRVVPRARPDVPGVAPPPGGRAGPASPAGGAGRAGPRPRRAGRGVGWLLGPLPLRRLGRRRRGLGHPAELLAARLVLL